MGSFNNKRRDFKDVSKSIIPKKEKKEIYDIGEKDDFSKIVYESVKKLIEKSIDFKNAFTIDISDSTSISIGAGLDVSEDYKLFNLEFGIEYIIKSVISIDTENKMEINGSIEVKLKGAFNLLEFIEIEGNNVLLKYELGFNFESKEKLIENITNIILIPIKYYSHLIYKYKNEIITAAKIAKHSLGIIFPLYGIYESSKQIFNNTNELKYEGVMFEFLLLLETCNQININKNELEIIIKKPDLIYPNKSGIKFNGININDDVVNINNYEFNIKDWSVDLIYKDNDIYFDIMYLKKYKFGKKNKPKYLSIKIEDEKSKKIDNYFEIFNELSKSKFIDNKEGNLLNFYLKKYVNQNYEIKGGFGIKDVFKINTSDSNEEFVKNQYTFNFKLYYENIISEKKTPIKYIELVESEATKLSVGFEYNVEINNEFINSIGIRTEIAKTDYKTIKKIILKSDRYKKELETKKKNTDIKFSYSKTDTLIIEQDEKLNNNYYHVLSDNLTANLSIKSRFYVICFVKVEKTLSFKFESTKKIIIDIKYIPKSLIHFEKVLLQKLK